MPQIHMAWAACCARFGPGPLHKGIDQLVDVKPTEKLGTGHGAAPYAGHMQRGGLYDMCMATACASCWKLVRNRPHNGAFLLVV